MDEIDNLREITKQSESEIGVISFESKTNSVKSDPEAKDRQIHRLLNHENERNLQSALGKAKSAVQQKEAELQQKEAEVAKLRSASEQLRAENEDLSQQLMLAASEKQLSKGPSLMRISAFDASGREGGAGDMRKRALLAERRANALQGDLERSKAELAASTAKIGRLLEEKRQSAAQSELLVDQLNAATSQLLSREGALRQLSAADQAGAAQTQRLHNEIAAAQVRAQENAQEQRRASKALKAAEQRLRERDEEAERLRREIDGAKAALQAAREGAQAADTRGESLAAQVRQLQLILAEDRARAQELREQLTAARNEAAAAKEELALVAAEKEAFFARSKGEHQKRSFEVSQLHQKAESALKDSKQAEKEKGELALQLEGKTLEIDRMAKEMKQREDEQRFGLERAERDLKRTQELLTAEREANERNVARFNEVLSNSSQRSAAEAKLKAEAVEKEREALEERLSAASQRAASLEGQLRETRATLRQQSESLGSDGFDLARQRLQLSEALEKAQKESDRFRAAVSKAAGVQNIAEIPAAIAEAKRQLAQREAELATVRAVLKIAAKADLSKETQKVQQKTESLDAIKELLKAGDSSVVAAVAALKTRIDLIALAFPEDDIEAVPVQVKEMRDREDSVLAILGNPEPKDAPEIVKAMKLREAEVCALFGDVTPNQAKKAIKKAKAIQDELNAVFGKGSASAVPKLVKEMKQRESEIALLFDSIRLAEIPKAIAEMKAREGRTASAFPSKQLSEIPSAVAEIKGREDQLCAIFKTQQPKDIAQCALELKQRDSEIAALFQGIAVCEVAQAVASMKRREERMMATLKPEEVGNLPKLVKEMKGREERMMATLGMSEAVHDTKATNLEEVGNLPKLVKEMKGREERMMADLNASDAFALPAIVHELKQREGKIGAIFGDIPPDDIPRLANEMKQRDDGVQGLFKGGNAVKHVKEMKAREERIAALLEAPAADLPGLIEGLKAREAELRDLHSTVSKALQTSNIVEATLAMKRVLDEVAAAVGAQSLNQIPKRISSIFDKLGRITADLEAAQRANQELESAIEAIGGDGSVEEKLKVALNRSRALERISQVVEAENGKDIGVSSVNGLDKDSFEKLGRITADLEAAQRAKQELSRLRRLESAIEAIVVEAEYGKDIAAGVAQMRSDLGAVAGLFSRIFALLFSQKMTLKFPLQQRVVDRLLGLVERFKRRSDDAHEQADTLLSEARSEGYVGEQIIDAANFVTQCCLKRERDHQAAIFKDELQMLQHNNEMIQQTAERQQKKFEKVIGDLKGQLESEKMQGSKREQQLLSIVDEARGEARRATDAMEKQKKVREELIRFIASDAADMEFLSYHLTKSESAALRMKQCL
jgi:hypothetical protein